MAVSWPLAAAASWFSNQFINSAKIQANVTDPLNDLAAKLLPAGTATSGGPTVAAATGFSTPVYSWELIGSNLLVLNIDVTRTGATLTGSSSGGVADTAIATIASGYRPAAVAWGNFTTSSTHGGAFVSTGGTVTITDLYPTSTIGSGDVLHSSWTYAIA